MKCLHRSLSFIPLILLLQGTLFHGGSTSCWAQGSEDLIWEVEEEIELDTLSSVIEENPFLTVEGDINHLHLGDDGDLSNLEAEYNEESSGDEEWDLNLLVPSSELNNSDSVSLETFYPSQYSTEERGEKESSVSRLPSRTPLSDDEFISRFVAQGEEDIPQSLSTKNQLIEEVQEKNLDTILINFKNVEIIEFIRFLSKISNRNFVFNEADLDFQVTIVSEEPTSIENIMTALIQELRIHGLMLIERENNLIIHKNPGVTSISKVEVDGEEQETGRSTELVTRVFRLNTMMPSNARDIIQNLVSEQAIVEISDETNQLIITDLVTNIDQIALLIKSLDVPSQAHVVGQYVVKNAVVDTLVNIAKQLIAPMAEGQQLTLVPYITGNSVFIVGNPHLVKRVISLLQQIDESGVKTGLYNLDKIRFDDEKKVIKEVPEQEGVARPRAGGVWQIDADGNSVFVPDTSTGEGVPQGNWVLDPQNRWFFVPAGTAAPFKPQLKRGETPSRPQGRWSLDREGHSVFKLAPGEAISPVTIRRKISRDVELPAGHIERTKFYVHKLQYRKGDGIVEALQNIGDNLDDSGNTSQDLIDTINSVQWIEQSNSLLFTGIEDVIDKMKELIAELDTPLRQVFIETLILETTLQDSLNYGVNWATRSGGGNTSTAQAFLSGASTVPGSQLPPNGGGITDGVINKPDASGLIGTGGYALGVIGQRLTHNGTQFATITALVKALHTQNNTNVILNPKIVTEDNAPAEIFVGVNTSFKTESVSNDEGSIITNNFEFRDVGTTLKVTPLIGRNNLITLDISQEVSRVVGSDTGGDSGDLTDSAAGPTTSINRTMTKVHVPDGYFVILSGMTRDEYTEDREQVPCLGGIPFIGAAFKDKGKTVTKLNTMIFMRPQIINTEEEYEKLTRNQQKVYESKNEFKKEWQYEVEEGLEFLNIKAPCCDECD